MINQFFSSYTFLPSYKNALKTAKIMDFKVNDTASDITIFFDNEIMIQTFRENSGYEAWSITSKTGDEYISVGPGKITKIKQRQV